MQRNLINKLKLIALAILSFTGCKTTTDDAPTAQIGNAKVYIDVQIGDNSQVVILATSSPKSSKSYVDNFDDFKSEDFVSGTGFDALVETELKKPENSTPESLQTKLRSLSKESIASPTDVSLISASSSLGSNIAYLVRIYADVNGNRGTQVGGDYTFRVGESSPIITLDAGTTYHWIAFSTNSAALPEIAGNNVSSAEAANKDIIYDSGQLTTIAGDNHLDIIFERKSSSIDVNLDSKGMFMPLNGNVDATANVGTGSGTSFASVIMTRAFDLLSGSYVGTAVVIPSDIQLDATVHAEKVVSFYSSDPIDIPVAELSVKLTNMEFKEWYAGGTVKFNRSSYLAINNADISLQPGDRFAVNIKLIMSAVNVDGILWSRDILSLRPQTTYGMQALRLHQPFGNHPIRLMSPYRDYWRWNSLSPEGAPNAGAYNTANDPCLTLYPAGMWRMPTVMEASTLLNRTPDRINHGWQRTIDPANNSSFSAIFNRTSGEATPEFVSPQNEMSIIFMGSRFASYPSGETSPYTNSITGYIPEVWKDGRADYPNGVAMFWTSEVGSVAGTAKAFVREIDFNRNSDGTETTATLLNGIIQDVDRNLGLNVRCVRSSSIPNT